MAISKVILNNVVQMDVTDTTAVPELVDSSVYFYGADGQRKPGTSIANLWQDGDIDITGSTGVVNMAITQPLPPGRYTIIVTNTTTWTGDNVFMSLHTVTSSMAPGNRVASITLPANGTSSQTFTISSTAIGARLEAADTIDHSAGYTATYSNIVIVKEPSIDMEAVTGVTPTESSQTIQPSAGNAGLSSVQINAIPSSYIGSGVKRVQTYLGTDSKASSAYTATAVSLTVAKTGTYSVGWDVWRTTTEGTTGSRLYINGTGYAEANTTFNRGDYGQHNKLTDVELTEGDVLVVRIKSRSSSYTTYCANLIIVEQ